MYRSKLFPDISAIPQLQPLLQDPDLRLQGVVADALVRLGAPAKIVMPSRMGS